MLEGAPDGSVVRLCDEATIESARVTPPKGTRAWFRGHALEKFGAQVRSLNWDSIEFDVDCPPLRQGRNELEVRLLPQSPRQADPVVLRGVEVSITYGKS